MNRTLLLVLCDFLLLNLLALTRWEQAEPPPLAKISAPAAAAAQSSQGQDLVDTMKLSLEDERTAREALSQRLQSSDRSLATLQSERTDLAGKLESTQKASEELARRVAAASEDATVSKARLAQTQRELDEKRRQADEQAKQLTALNEQQAEARQRIEGLAVAVKVAEQEKLLLRETADTLKTQVVAERQERIRVQETTTQLAQGVGQLAEQSTSLTKEIRDNRPVNANTLFSDFLANRVQTSFTAFRKTYFSPIDRVKDARTVLITDGKAIYALLHIDDTPLNLGEKAENWERLTATFNKGGYKASAREISFLAVDPRVVAIPVSQEEATALGVKVYQTALDPFKFPEAVLISSGGAGYGEVPFKLEPTNASYVRMDNRLVRRLFGNFSPSRGDLVLSKTGEILGIMVNNEYCAVIDNFLPAQTLALGNALAETATAPKLQNLNRRWRSLPSRMQ